MSRPITVLSERWHSPSVVQGKMSRALSANVTYHPADGGVAARCGRERIIRTS
jgi:hypothetical protein